MSSLTLLCKNLGYQFKDMSLLELALSHRSAPGMSNERLEFLGDAILNFTIAAALYQQFPQAKEGELSRFRAALVKGETLAQLAKEFDLSTYLRLGIGELKTGGAYRESIQADCVEAIIGAIYLDASIDVARDRILAWFATRLAAIDAATFTKDPKTQLQEYMQSKKLPLPTYKVTATTGKSHAQRFHIECCVKGLPHVTEGEGSTRRKAEQAAAKAYLTKVDPNDRH